MKIDEKQSKWMNAPKHFIEKQKYKKKLWKGFKKINI
jgi:hypothetical protein